MPVSKPVAVSDEHACVDAIIARVGKHIVLGLPLGLGKPVRIVNALYRRARQDPELQLHIVTALSMLAPVGQSSLERRFLKPLVARLYSDIPELEYARDAARQRLPANVKVSEFFFKAGSALTNPDQQRHYMCTNYTHALRDILAQGVNVVTQLVAPSLTAGDQVSLSCNPDLSLDLFPELRAREQQGAPVALVAEVNANLPYMGRDAEVPAATFDLLFACPSTEYPLFSVPQMAVSQADHAIGFYASTLLKDGGTLQVGIGSLGTALVHSTIVRHTRNAQWRRVYQTLNVAARFPLAQRIGGDDVFRQGLYGCSEMLVDGFLQLLEAGVLTREVYGHARLQELVNAGAIAPEVSMATLDCLRAERLIESPMRARDVQWLQHHGVFHQAVTFRDGLLVAGGQSVVPDLDSARARQQMATSVLGQRLAGGTVLHGGFFLGPNDFYRRLRTLPAKVRDKICMTSVNYINHLYDHRFGLQALKVAQRRESRLINSAMICTLGGAVVSDGLDDGRVVSGVGGQYNFVAMAHELPAARSIICLRSTRKSAGKTVSNIVFHYGHCTIPRHLRDIVITEYGIADLRGRSDETVCLQLIRIADARFQAELLKQAQKAGKVAAEFKLPADWRKNTPAALAQAFGCEEYAGMFPEFPFGTDLTGQERTLAKALGRLQAVTATRRGKLVTLWRALMHSGDHSGLEPLLQRMQLSRPTGLRARLDRRLLTYALRELISSVSTPVPKGTTNS
ncbi:acetyl-CoA hydrolase/transferase C-terminal domain-containing protein [Marinobacter sp. X15-166B]|uniref:acetyl-CoA hydrolase/transferase C-terminal domain-containing protein n=1 Tax=Marinobacter sp. X15-166B TaxID=1897620 RepID=UPI00085C4F3E|nr:acetyl-CoA hydrolase/transferase C-terminal domain-containing protein [Marinobacter sp. X15-166B]OEY66874.1 acetyl-CoA hydrolase [Marinobacter sp. X15-166B]